MAHFEQQIFDPREALFDRWRDDGDVLGPHSGRQILARLISWLSRDTAIPGASRAKLEEINIHLHDLRHEAGCRCLEQGWPVHRVQEMLGHADVSQTSTYVHASETGLRESVRRFEASCGKPCQSRTPSSTRLLATSNAKQTTMTCYTDSCEPLAPVAQRIEHPPPKRPTVVIGRDRSRISGPITRGPS